MTTQQKENERLARVEEKTDGLVEDVAEIKTELKDFIKTADQKYAPAWTAKAMGWFITLVMGILLTTIFNSYIKEPEPVRTEVQVTAPQK